MAASPTQTTNLETMEESVYTLQMVEEIRN